MIAATTLVLSIISSMEVLSRFLAIEQSMQQELSIHWYLTLTLLLFSNLTFPKDALLQNFVLSC